MPTLRSLEQAQDLFGVCFCGGTLSLSGSLLNPHAVVCCHVRSHDTSTWHMAKLLTARCCTLPRPNEQVFKGDVLVQATDMFYTRGRDANCEPPPHPRGQNDYDTFYLDRLLMPRADPRPKNASQFTFHGQNQLTVGSTSSGPNTGGGRLNPKRALPQISSEGVQEASGPTACQHTADARAAPFLGHSVRPQVP